MTEVKEQIKFSETEMESLTGLSTGYQSIQFEFGQLRIRKMAIKAELDAIEVREDALEGEYRTQQETEQTLVKELTEKYGPGTLNPDTGAFTPTEQG
jgi:hypothetical protein